MENVSNVVISGAMPVQWTLSYNTFKMLSCGVAVNDLRNSIAKYLRSANLGASIN
jgi:hypothetical protein